MTEFSVYGNTAGYLSTMIALLYFGTIYGLEKLGSSTIFSPTFRGSLADYAYPLCRSVINPLTVLCQLMNIQIGTLWWVGFSYIPGNLAGARISHVPITTAFHPTQPRSWLIDFWLLDLKWIFIAAPFGFLVMLLFYYDHIENAHFRLS